MSEIGRMLKISKQRVSQIAKVPLLKNKLCLNCKKEFIPVNSQKYCSLSCRKDAYKKLRRNVEPRTCHKCSKKFSRLWGSKYCHNPCK